QKPTLLPLAQPLSRAGSVVFPVEEWHIHLGLVWFWRQRGVRDFWFRHPNLWKRIDAEALFAGRLYQKVFGRALRWVLPNLRIDTARAEQGFVSWAMRRRRHYGVPEVRLTQEERSGTRMWDDFVRADQAVLAAEKARPAAQPLRVTQYIGALFPGGAERQLCNLSLGLARRGHGVRVLTAHALT